MMSGKERRGMAAELLGREPTEDEINKVLGVSTPEDVRAVCADLLRNPGYYPDSYAGKATLRSAFLRAMLGTPNVDVTLIKEAFHGALSEYMKHIEAI